MREILASEVNMICDWGKRQRIQNTGVNGSELLRASQAILTYTGVLVS